MYMVVCTTEEHTNAQHLHIHQSNDSTFAQCSQGTGIQLLLNVLDLPFPFCLLHFVFFDLSPADFYVDVCAIDSIESIMALEFKHKIEKEEKKS